MGRCTNSALRRGPRGNSSSFGRHVPRPRNRGLIPGRRPARSFLLRVPGRSRTSRTSDNFRLLPLLNSLSPLDALLPSLETISPSITCLLIVRDRGSPRTSCLPSKLSPLLGASVVVITSEGGVLPDYLGVVIDHRHPRLDVLLVHLLLRCRCSHLCLNPAILGRFARGQHAVRVRLGHNRYPGRLWSDLSLLASFLLLLLVPVQRMNVRRQ